MTRLAYAFLPLAAAGFAAVLVMHIAALFGVTWIFDHWLAYLGPGLFVVWLPTILIMGSLTRDFKQKEVWRAALRGCPAWMRRAQWALFGYAWVGFFALPLIFGGGMDNPANKARSMSAVLLTFYSIAATVFYSATRAGKIDVGRRCLNGHRISPLAKFCDECGAPVQASPVEPAANSMLP
jgi:hypothetical protein